jgi:hypothetical protein
VLSRWAQRVQGTESRGPDEKETAGWGEGGGARTWRPSPEGWGEGEGIGDRPHAGGSFRNAPAKGALGGSLAKRGEEETVLKGIGAAGGSLERKERKQCRRPSVHPSALPTRKPMIDDNGSEEKNTG